MPGRLLASLPPQSGSLLIPSASAMDRHETAHLTQRQPHADQATRCQTVLKKSANAAGSGQVSRQRARLSLRPTFAQRLQEIINRYNAGGASNESYFDELVKFTKEMKEEDQRHFREGLTEDELALFDLLKKEMMTKAEEQAVKLAAQKLLEPPEDGHAARAGAGLVQG